MSTDGDKDWLVLLRSAPPRIFAAVPRTTLGTVDTAGDGADLASLDVSASLVCACGCSEFKVNGYRWSNPESSSAQEVLLSPIRIVCSSCQNDNELLDTRMHGWDGEFGNGQYSAVWGPEAKGASRTDAGCLHCGKTNWFLSVRLTYPAEVFDGPLKRPSGEIANPADLFDTFSLGGVCVVCKTHSEITGFELA